jgi:hypothetical protein
MSLRGIPRWLEPYVVELSLPNALTRQGQWKTTWEQQNSLGCGHEKTYGLYADLLLWQNVAEELTACNVADGLLPASSLGKPNSCRASEGAWQTPCNSPQSSGTLYSPYSVPKDSFLEARSSPCDLVICLSLISFPSLANGLRTGTLTSTRDMNTRKWHRMKIDARGSAHVFHLILRSLGIPLTIIQTHGKVRTSVWPFLDLVTICPQVGRWLLTMNRMFKQMPRVLGS